MIFAKKQNMVWCDDPPEDRVISIVAGCLANHDRAHSQYVCVLMFRGEKNIGCVSIHIFLVRRVCVRHALYIFSTCLSPSKCNRKVRRSIETVFDQLKGFLLTGIPLTDTSFIFPTIKG
jgi:hypothetical protein